MGKIIYNYPKTVYAAWRKDEKARAQSSSGGIASVVAEHWIHEGGIVYGVSFVKPFGFQHVRCSKVEELAMLRGSKYVQSSMTGVVKQLDEDVCNGRRVLFIGTPCQVAGIVSKYRSKGEQVVTIDIICHGTPKVDTFMASLPKAVLSMDFDNVEFRDCGRYQLSFKKNGNIVWTRPLAKDLYMKGFFKALFYKECCYKCVFARKERVGDLTLGDFWGVDLRAVNTDMKKGISLVMVNTENGRRLIQMTRNAIEKIERPLEEAVAGNGQLRHPVKSGWRKTIFNFFLPKVGFRLACIIAMPDVYMKNLLK